MMSAKIALLMFFQSCVKIIINENRGHERSVTDRMEDENERIRKTLAALDEIDRLLHQMLILAELSAGEGSMNRGNLQKVMEYLQRKIDRIADRMNTF